MWTVFKELQGVLQAPVIEKRVVTLLHDDSGRRVDMTEIKNLFCSINVMLLDSVQFEGQLCSNIS